MPLVHPLLPFASRRTFLKQLGAAAGTAFLSPAGRLWAADAFTLPRSTPEAAGVSSAGIVAFLEALAKTKIELHSLMIVRRGKVVAEGWWSPYAADLRHTLYSLSKSFTSTAVGFAVSEGKLTVEDRVSSFFPNDLPDPVSDNLAALQVKHLLTMSVGNEHEPTGAMVKEENWVRSFLGAPITHAPGSVFLYNSAATYVCSAIVQKVTGRRVLDYLTPRLFEPLGIEGATWETCPLGINTGGWGLSLETEDLAKFGQFYRQKGHWLGRQVLPAEWIDAATSFKIQQPDPAKPPRPKEENDWLQGYCYQFWRCRHGAFRGDGAFGQLMIVMPEQDAVIAVTAETGNMQGELDLVWEHLLPAMKNTVLPADPAAQARLAETLASLTLPPPLGQPASATAARVGGKAFQFEANALGFETATLAFEPDACRLTLRAGQADHSIVCGLEKWVRGETDLPGTPPRLVSGGAPKPGTASKVAASGTWKDENTFQILCRYIETPHHDTVSCRFDGDKLEIGFLNSIAAASGKTKDDRPTLVGKTAG